MFKQITIYLTTDKSKKTKMWVDNTLTGFEYYEQIRKKHLFWHSIE